MFDVSRGPQSSMEESELSTSGVSGQSTSGKGQKRDDYKGPLQPNPICSPARSVNESPIGSVHSHHSSRSHHGSQVSSVSSVTRIQYEEQIQKLKDELKEKNALLAETVMRIENSIQKSLNGEGWNAIIQGMRNFW